MLKTNNEIVTLKFIFFSDGTMDHRPKNLLIILIIFVLCFSVVVTYSTLSWLPSERFQDRRIRVSVDFAPRFIGLAYSDLLGKVHPHCTFKNQLNQISVAQHILDFATQKSAIEVVLGLPLDKDGRVGYSVSNFNGRLCLNFSRVLSSLSKHQYGDKVKIRLFDERYSTREAFLKREEGLHGSKDSIAAACILERYLEDRGQGSLTAIPCGYPIPSDLSIFDYQKVKDYVRSCMEDENRSELFFKKGVSIKSFVENMML